MPVKVNDVVDLCLESEEASSDLEIVGEQAGGSDKVTRMQSTGSLDLSMSFTEDDENYPVEVKINWKFQTRKTFKILKVSNH